MFYSSDGDVRTRTTLLLPPRANFLCDRRLVTVIVAGNKPNKEARQEQEQEHQHQHRSSYCNHNSNDADRNIVIARYMKEHAIARAMQEHATLAAATAADATAAASSEVNIFVGVRKVG